MTPKDKYGNPKNLNPCKKNYRRRRFPQNLKTFMKFYRQRTIADKIRGVNPAFYSLFLNDEEMRALKPLEGELLAVLDKTTSRLFSKTPTRLDGQPFA